MSVTRTNMTAWYSLEGKLELLRTTGAGEYYIPLSTIDRTTLQALRDAIGDALARETETKQQPEVTYVN
jgi:hypothetical protein